MELRGQHPPEELFDKEIMERVLGCDLIYLRGWGGLLVSQLLLYIMKILWVINQLMKS